MRLQSILVPLDGSRLGEFALPLAASLARRAGAQIEVVHVREPLTIPNLRLPALEAEDRQARAWAQGYLDRVVDQWSPAVPAGVTRHLVIGRPADGLCEFVDTVGADLVVMTTHGRGPLSRLWLGSVATELVQRLPAPVLITRPGDEPPDPAQDPAPRRLLIPLDGSRFSEQVLPLAIAVGTLTGAEYRLLRVVQKTHDWGDGVVDATGSNPTGGEESQAQSYLDNLTTTNPALRTAEVRVVVDSSPALAVLAEAEGSGADLIVMETRGHSGLARLLLGSVADKVVRGTTIPVLLRRPLAE